MKTPQKNLIMVNIQKSVEKAQAVENTAKRAKFIVNDFLLPILKLNNAELVFYIRLTHLYRLPVRQFTEDDTSNQHAGQEYCIAQGVIPFLFASEFKLQFIKPIPH